jgi:hypothetical protein
MFLIDLDIPPTIYRTDNKDYYGKFYIDFMPENTPTIASFDTLKEVKDYLIKTFGEEQYIKWFPNGLAEELSDGQVDYVE